MDTLPEPAMDPPADTSPELCRDFAELSAADPDVADKLLRDTFERDGDFTAMFAECDVIAFVKACGRMDAEAGRLAGRMEIARVR